MKYLESKNTLQISHRLRKNTPHIKESALQKCLDRELSFRRLDAKLWREGISSPKARTTVIPELTFKQQLRVMTVPYATVAAASFWYPQGHRPRSSSVCPPPRTPFSHAAPGSSNPCMSNPTASRVHAGAPDPPE